MSSFSQKLKNSVEFLYKYFPIVGGYSVKDADDLMKNPSKYNYRGNSWFKKQEDKVLKKK